MILFVDDERKYIKDYIEELEFVGFRVNHINNLIDAQKFIESEEGKEIELLVLDVMMPSGKIHISDEFDDYLDNGLEFYKEFRIIFPKTKVFILTNVTRQGVRDFFEKEENCSFNEKDGKIVEFAARVKNEVEG